MRKKLSPTFRLFAVPSFLTGLAMAVDFGQSMPQYNENTRPERADYLALLADARAVAGDCLAATVALGIDHGPQE